MALPESAIAMCSSQEDRPHLRSLSETSVSRIWFALSVGALVVGWCVLDSWNHESTSGIFQHIAVKDEVLNPFTGQTLIEHEHFTYTLTLAFLQFAFLGLVFCSIFAVKAASAGGSMIDILGHLRSTASDGKWPALVGTHMCGSLLLQSLIMPTNIMSLGLFAATRAVEIPVAAGVRAKVFEARFGGHKPLTTGLMFAAAWLLFYSYTQISECLCVWSGFGVALTGVSLYFVYALLLTIPATNMVLQESVMVQLDVDPLLMQGIQNLCAAILFVPTLIVAHSSGYEDVTGAMRMIVSHRDVYMTVLWLCMQTAFISAVGVGLILMTDSFWAVAARSLRVVFWWVRQLPFFYVSSGTLLSVARPHASLWSFVMVCGIVLGFSALILDSKPSEEVVQVKRPSSFSEPFGQGMSRARYV